MKTPQEQIREIIRHNELLDIGEIMHFKNVASNFRFNSARFCESIRFENELDAERFGLMLEKIISWL